MIVYEVNLQIDSQVADDYAAWLKPHIEHILQIKGFRHADWYVCDSSDDKVHWSIRYHLDKRSSLANYLDNYAPMLIQEGIDKFGDHLTSNRRIMVLKN